MIKDRIKTQPCNTFRRLDTITFQAQLQLQSHHQSRTNPCAKTRYDKHQPPWPSPQIPSAIMALGISKRY